MIPNLIQQMTTETGEKNLFSACEFRENHTLRRCANGFLSVLSTICLIWIKCSIWDMHIMTFWIYGFRETWTQARLYVLTRTVKRRNILKAKNALSMPVQHVTEYTTRSFVTLLDGLVDLVCHYTKQQFVSVSRYLQTITQNRIRCVQHVARMGQR